MTKPILSLQLYSLRDLGPVDLQLGVAAEAGFANIEPLESHLRSRSELSQALQRHALRAPTAHISLEGLRTDLSELADACMKCGVTSIFVPHPWRTFHRDEASAWQKMGDQLATMADILGRQGLALGYHNKAAGFTPMRGGRCGVDVLFDTARGSRLCWQADIGWMHSAGVDPSAWLKRYSRELVSAHVKDRAPDGSNIDEDGWADVGAGVMLWPSLWRDAIRNGARILVVEHDNPKQPAEFAARSFKYLSRFLAS